MKSANEPDGQAEFRTHLRFGWWSLLVFLTLGIVLEALHGFKVQWYLNVANSTRRLMFTLAHAHGTLFSLINIAFAVCLPHARAWRPERRAVASMCLVSASILVPGGFLLGGLRIYSGDPGLGIVLVPVGACLLLTAVVMTAMAMSTVGNPNPGTAADVPAKESSNKGKAGKN